MMSSESGLFTRAGDERRCDGVETLDKTSIMFGSLRSHTRALSLSLAPSLFSRMPMLQIIS